MTRPLLVLLTSTSRHLRRLSLLPAVVSLLSLGVGPPVHVEPIHTDPIHVDPRSSEGSELKDGKDTPAVKSPKLPHAHFQGAASEEEEVWLRMKQEIGEWNELCESFVNSTGVLARIVSLDRQFPVERAPFGFETCKRDSTYAHYGNDAAAIISLNDLRKKSDGAALAVIEQMLTVCGGSDGSCAEMKSVLHYLANRSNMNCLPEPPHGPQVDVHRAFMELLREVAAKRHMGSAKSDQVALAQAEAALYMDAQLSGHNTQAVRQAAALLTTCFKHE